MESSFSQEATIGKLEDGTRHSLLAYPEREEQNPCGVQSRNGADSSSVFHWKAPVFHGNLWVTRTRWCSVNHFKAVLYMALVALAQLHCESHPTIAIGVVEQDAEVSGADPANADGNDELDGQSEEDASERIGPEESETGSACASKECDDGNPCTLDECNPESGGCESVALPNLLCDDGNSCTIGETCDGEGECTNGTERDCSDGEVCTLDGCDPALGCAHEPGNSGSDVTGMHAPPWTPVSRGNVPEAGISSVTMGIRARVRNAIPTSDV